MTSDREINKEVKNNLKGLNSFQKKKFEEVMNTGWARSYARGSKDKLKKIVKKVKRGIKHGKYGRGTAPVEEVSRGWKKPTPKEKQKEKETQKRTRKERRKETEKQKRDKSFAPSGRKYSYTEIHEGKGSKRAKEYRKKNKISEKDWSY